MHVAVRKGAHRLAVDYPPTEVHVFNDESFDVSRAEVGHGDRERFAITSRAVRGYERWRSDGARPVWQRLSMRQSHTESHAGSHVLMFSLGWGKLGKLVGAPTR